MNSKNVTRISDVVAMVTFSFVTGMAIEIGIAGLTLEQSLISRFSSIPLNILTARFFGVYRDWLLNLSGNTERFWVKTLVDLIAFISFQIPIYIIVLLVSGAGVSEIIKAVSGVVVLFTFMGSIYGVYLDYCRRFFNKLLLKTDTESSPS